MSGNNLEGFWYNQLAFSRQRFLLNLSWKGRQSATCYLAIGYGNKQGRSTVHYLCYSCCKPNRIEGLHRERIALDSNTITLTSFFNLPQLVEVIAVTRFMV